MDIDIHDHTAYVAAITAGFPLNLVIRRQLDRHANIRS